MAKIMCLPTGTAKASKPQSQPARKYAENSGIALVMKNAPISYAGAVSSLLGVLRYAFAGVSGATLALAYDATLTPFITAMLLCAVGALIAFVVATRLTAETVTPLDGRTAEYS
ncbi:hypothetical protein [Afipia sp. GAS231]|uniref:hypothetical protein n=1 Tax=Afipia sp. GAS231 TaxID=1882747 RepID=UPI0012F9020E|nr:hypothetical protein [Afipia sp. GAS231]